MKKYTIILFIFSLSLLFISCHKTRTISENETDEPEEIISTVERDIIESKDLEQTVIQSNDERHIPIRERAALPFIEAVRRGDRNEIVKFFKYPIRQYRPFPLPYIKNEQEMLERFDMIFTDEVLDDIVNSSDNEWNAEAWRGVFFYNDRTWLWMDYDGTVLGIHASNQEEELVREFWKRDRERLLPEFRQYDNCVGLFASTTYILRLDSFTIDRDTYTFRFRLLIWERNNSKTMSDMPDIILTDGESRSYGNTGRSLYYFINNDRVYVILEPYDFYYIDKGALFIGEYTESFEPMLYDEYESILSEEIVWSE
ncbi:MAG: hypothetical protein LBI28_09560 [Treponema sp.]|jgi:hypothetical protein|nr:hypothetical protein [Treponema sp.]